MLTARQTVAAMLTATGLLVGGVVASNVLFPKPVVSASTLTLRSTDSIGAVIVWTKRCSGAACPTQWFLDVQRKTDGGYSTEAERVLSRTRDTVRIAKSVCADTGKLVPDTLLISVLAMGKDSAEQSNVATTKLAVRCRPLRSIERVQIAAELDTFPKANRRMVAGDWSYPIPKDRRTVMLVAQLRELKTAKDSADLRALFASLDARSDSTALPSAARVAVPVGETRSLCWLARNRYTNEVVVMGGDIIACEAPRARMQSEGSG